MRTVTDGPRSPSSTESCERRSQLPARLNCWFAARRWPNFRAKRSRRWPARRGSRSSTRLTEDRNFRRARAGRWRLRLMRRRAPVTSRRLPNSSAAGFERIMLEFEWPWAFLLLPLPLVVWWLLPAFRDQQTSVHVPFFDRLAEATGQTPQPGAVVLRRRAIQMISATVIWLLLVTAL